MRRITSGIQGGPILGTFSATDNNLKTLEPDSDIVLDPNGNGEIKATSHLQMNSAGEIKFADADSTNYVSLKAPATLNSNYVYTLPSTGPTNGHILQTDGSGNLSWTDTNFEIADQQADSSTYNVTITTASSGNVTGLNTSSGKLTFQPSTGTLTTSTVNAGSSTITGTLNAGTINETSSAILKENITTINDALSKVLMFEGVNYTRKATGGYEAGLIAEEVEKIAPELVSREGEYAAINYTRITAYLVEAVKELSKQIDNLTGK